MSSFHNTTWATVVLTFSYIYIYNFLTFFHLSGKGDELKSLSLSLTHKGDCTRRRRGGGSSEQRRAEASV